MNQRQRLAIIEKLANKYFRKLAVTEEEYERGLSDADIAERRCCSVDHDRESFENLDLKDALFALQQHIEKEDLVESISGDDEITLKSLCRKYLPS